MHEATRKRGKRLCEALNKNTWISRRELFVLAAAGLVTGCSSSLPPQPLVNLPTPTFAVLEPRVSISLANASQIKQLATLNLNSGRVRGVAWAPDGRTLAVGAMNSVQLWDVSAGKRLATLHGHNGQVYQLSWSPDGRLLASGADDNTTRIWDVQNRSAVHVLQGAASVILSLAWSPDGKRLAAGSDTDIVQIWERATWAKPALWSGPGMPGQYRAGRFRQGVYSVAWSSDGKYAAGVRYDGYVRVWNARSGQLLHALVSSNQPNGVSWSPSGHVLASSSDDGTVQFWDVATYKNTRTLQSTDQDQAGWAYAIPWSPDGRLLATSRNAGIVQIWDASSGKELAVLQGHSDSVWTAAWSPDNLRIAAGSDDGSVSLWGVR